MCNSARTTLQRRSYFVTDGKLIELLSRTGAALPMVCISSYRRHPDYVASTQLCLIRMRQSSCQGLSFPGLPRSLGGWQMNLTLTFFKPDWLYCFDIAKALFLKLYVGISLSLNFLPLGKHRLCSSPSVGGNCTLHRKSQRCVCRRENLYLCTPRSASGGFVMWELPEELL